MHYLHSWLPLLLSAAFLLAAGCAGPQGGPAAGQTPVNTPAIATAPAELRLTTVFFFDQAHGWVAGTEGACPDTPCHGVIFATTDGGTSWTRTYEGDVAPLSLHFTDPQTGWAAGGEARGGYRLDRDPAVNGTLLATTDGGRTWAPVHTAPGGAFLSVQFPAPAEGWLTDRSGSLHRSTNGGRSWDRAGGPPCAHWISFPQPDTGYALCGGDQPGAGNGGKSLHVTRDGGRSWSTLDRVYNPETRRPQGLPFAGYARGLGFATAQDGWVALARAGLLHTADGGATWTPALPQMMEQNLPFAPGEALAVSFPTPALGFALFQPGLLAATADGGQTWRLVAPPQTETPPGK